MSSIYLEKNIIIVGGHGQMGQLFMRLLQSQGHTVTALGEKDWRRAKTLLGGADLVMVAVPIALTDLIIRKTALYLKPTCVLVDITSLKEKPLKTMLGAHKGPVLGLHPVFGPTIDKPNGQVIVCCKGREPNACAWVVKSLTQLGFELYPMTAKAHDKAMNVVQGLAHFLTYCMGIFLQQSQISLTELLKVSTPLFRLQLNMLGRIFYQDPALYADIIMSDNSRLKTLKQFIGLATKLSQNKRAVFIKQFASVKKWLGPFAKEAQDKTDVLLNAAFNLPTPTHRQRRQ